MMGQGERGVEVMRAGGREIEGKKGAGEET